VRTAFRIDASLGEPQTLNGAAADQVFFHDFGRVFGLDEAVPDGIWINHHRGPMFALIQAQRFVDSDAVGETRGLRQLLQLGVQFALPIGSA
jgi:hypothetical protein